MEGVKETVTYSTHNTSVCMCCFHNSINIVSPLQREECCITDSEQGYILLLQGVSELFKKQNSPICLPSLPPGSPLLLSSQKLYKIQQMAIVIGKFLISLCCITKLRQRSNRRRCYLFLFCCAIGVVIVLGKSPKKQQRSWGKQAALRLERESSLMLLGRYCLEQLLNNS